MARRKIEDVEIKKQHARIMRSYGMTQAAIAELMGVSQPTIGLWLDPVMYARLKDYQRERYQRKILA